MLTARLGAKMESLFSFLVGLFHSLQHAGLSRRSKYGRQHRSCASLPSNHGARLRSTSSVSALDPKHECNAASPPAFVGNFSRKEDGCVGHSAVAGLRSEFANLTRY